MVSMMKHIKNWRITLDVFKFNNNIYVVENQKNWRITLDVFKFQMIIFHLLHQPIEE